MSDDSPSTSLDPASAHLARIRAAAQQRWSATGDGTAPTPPRLAVVGGGQMGAGIAATALSRGMGATVRDVDDARLADARDRAQRAVGGAPMNGWRGTTSWDGFDAAEVVVEAVFELPDVKRETLAAIDAHVGPDTLVTTNTSAIPVTSLAGSLSRPERFLGTHFFSPVDKMPLVELVPHPGTNAAALARAGALATALGKVPVMVADYPGFFTSRVYARWLIEGLRLLLDGAESSQIEQEATDVGFPLGPLRACDEVTLDLVMAASITQVAEPVFADRLPVADVKALLERLIDAGHHGKAHGRGFYSYFDGRREGIDPEISGVVGAANSDVPPGTAGERLLLAFVTEALLCWDDGTLCHPDDGDLASLLGIGFPRALGGPFFWTDQLGSAEVLRRCREQNSTGFPVSESLARIAADSGCFADEYRRELPGR